MDVRKPLKCKKKIVKKDGKEFTITCKYETLGEFCFCVEWSLIHRDFAGNISIIEVKKL